MERKEKCEKVVLTKEESRILKQIHQNPKAECNEKVAKSLYFMGLVTPERIGDNYDFSHCTTSEFYNVYIAYSKARKKDQLFQSLWLPIVVSIVTTLVANALQWSWPLISQWFASYLLKSLA